MSERTSETRTAAPTSNPPVDTETQQNAALHSMNNSSSNASSAFKRPRDSQQSEPDNGVSSKKRIEKRRKSKSIIFKKDLKEAAAEKEINAIMHSIDEDVEVGDAFTSSTKQFPTTSQESPVNVANRYHKNNKNVNLKAGRPGYNFSKWKVGKRYKLIKILGHGSYGEVAEAFDLKTKQKVAIKRINNVFDHEMDTKRILRECYILRHLNNPHVIQLLNIIPPENSNNFNELYLVLEFVDTDLHKLINSPQYLTIDHIKIFLYQLLCALKYIHSTKVIHRDVKPANILLNEDCALKVCDFGLARVMRDGDKSSKIERNDTIQNPPKSVEAVEAAKEDNNNNQQPQKLQRQLTKHVVTRWYRPPELILLQEYTYAVDMWSVGCIFAELLSMQQSSVPTYRERVPLFPGKSCFPLSADNERSYKDNLDQLNVIFNVIGTPLEEDVSHLGGVQHYLRGLTPKEPRKFNLMYKGAPQEAVDMLSKVLVFNPAKRLSVDEALNHAFLKSVRKQATEEVVASKPVDMGEEYFTMTKEQLTQRLKEEIQFYCEENEGYE